MSGISELTQDQWKRLIDRLTIYAQRKYIRLGWCKRGQYRSPSGQGPEDIASEAIMLLFEGKRNYDEQKYPDLIMYLRSVVDSVIYHIIKSADFQKTKPMPKIITAGGETKEIEIESEEADPSQVYVQNDLSDKMNSILQEKFAQDKVVSGILECMKAGIYKDSEIAECCDIEVKEVYNAQKRLRREFDKTRDAF